MHSNKSSARSLYIYSRSEKDKIYARIKTITSIIMTGELISGTNVFIKKFMQNRQCFWGIDF